MKRFFPLLWVMLACNCSLLSAQDAGFTNAVDSINAKLEQWCEPGNVVYITAKQNGEVSIVNKRAQYQHFNVFDLASKTNDESNRKNGIEFVTCEPRSHAPLTLMNFYTANRQVAFIRLTCKIPSAELENMYNAFMHLKSLCKKS